MFTHNKKLQYTVRVSESDPVLASLILEQFGGPQGELAAAMRYFTQALAEEDAGRKDMLLDIATEELSHLEIIGSIVAMLNRGIKGELAEARESEAELYRSLTRGGDSHTQALLFGGGPALTNSSGVPWSAAYIDSIGDPACDLRSDIAAESRAKIIYERLINVTSDPGVKQALGFLMTREIAHQISFEKALYSIEHNFPPGKLYGMAEFSNLYVNTSQGEGDAEGPWNSGGEWKRLDDVVGRIPLDGGAGTASVDLDEDERRVVETFAERLESDASSNPLTGAELGGNGAHAQTARKATHPRAKATPPRASR
jgi:Mn-containing catalase